MNDATMNQLPAAYDPRRALVIHDPVRPDLVEQLRLLVEEMARRDAGRPRSGSLNVGGWKSETGFHRTAEAPHELVASILAHYLAPHLGNIHPARVSSWAIVNHRGSLHQRHNHQGAVISGIYYVCPGEPPTSPTVFEVPGSAPVLVHPAPGRLAIFPGSMFHRVPPYHGAAPRITVAFDVAR